MALRREALTKCLHCGELIQSDALKCKYCREFLYPVQKAANRYRNRKSSTWKVILLLFLYIISLLAFFTGYNWFYDSPEDNSKVGSDNIKPIESYSRLKNGEELIPRESLGEGVLKIENGTDDDAIIKIIPIDRSTTHASVYIRSKKDFSVEDIPDGEFNVLINTGRDYQQESESFMLSKSYYRFESSLTFKTSAQDYTIYNITLHPVEGGRALTTGISQEVFESY